MTRLVPRPRAARTALLSATALSGLVTLSPATASAGQFPVAIGQSADPLLQNLSIPANAAQVGLRHPLISRECNQSLDCA